MFNFLFKSFLSSVKIYFKCMVNFKADKIEERASAFESIAMKCNLRACHEMVSFYTTIAKKYETEDTLRFVDRRSHTIMPGWHNVLMR